MANYQGLEQTERLLEQILQSGVSEMDILEQLYTFKHGLPYIRLAAPCTVASGTIWQIGENAVGASSTRKGDIEDVDSLLRHGENAIAEGRAIKFVPASGAATRMFKSLLAVLSESESQNTPLTLATLAERASGSSVNGSSTTGASVADYRFALNTAKEIERFAFFSALASALGYASPDDFRAAFEKENFDWAPVFKAITGETGLNYARLPKGLILFHRYREPDGSLYFRTAFEEHIVEALHYACSRVAGKRLARLHFTVSPEHRAAVESHVSEAIKRFHDMDTRIDIEFSEQKRSTDTIAVTPENEPFLTEDGLHFRPAGHGALLENLNDLKGDIIFIKNIDNVAPEGRKGEDYRYKKILCGLAVALQERVFAYLRDLEPFALAAAAADLSPSQEALVRESLDFGARVFAWNFPPATERYTPGEWARAAFRLLNRPLRVCGMVKNEGEPGGGPFVVEDDEGWRSLQIVESAQINLADARQKEIFAASTHFNPVDIVAAVRNYKGEPFNLLDFRDGKTGFISLKSSAGRELKALELPGLWNGSMAYWNTVFVEIPAQSFNPVKTLLDLLRPEHQAET
jgi:hypothetical protein